MLTVHCSWVHTAVTTETVVCPVRATRNDRPDAFTSAAFPTVASGELVSTFSVIVLLTIDAGIVGRLGKPLPVPLDDVGLLLLPPQPVTAVTMAASDAV